MIRSCAKTSGVFFWLIWAAHAQSPAAFEVASNVENLPLRSLIRLAFNVKDFQIAGGLAWMNSDAYDVSAKAESGFTPEQMHPMLQTLLAERFQLKLHHETKDAPNYELTAAKGGLKLAASTAGNCVALDPKNPPRPLRAGEKLPNYCGIIRMGRGVIHANGVPMVRLLIALSDLLGRTVIDKTGFAGTFDINLEFTPDQAIVDPVVGGPPRRGEPAPSADPSGPSIFTALQEQLGLKLESAKGPIEMLVIDHAERPSEN